VLVGPLNAVGLMVRQCRASHLLTCLHDDLVQTPITIERARHLRLVMHDIAEALPDHTPPDARHIARIIDFAHDWGGHSAMVVHCFAGISRSTAAPQPSIIIPVWPVGTMTAEAPSRRPAATSSRATDILPIALSVPTVRITRLPGKCRRPSVVSIRSGGRR